MKKGIFLSTRLLFSLNILFLLLLISHCNFSFTQGVWTQKADLPGAIRTSAIGFSFSNCGYLGFGTNQISGPHNDLWRYDPASNTWAQKAAFGGLASIANTVAFSIANKGYIGTTIGSNYKDFWEYDTTANTWTQKADFGGAGRWGASGFAIGNKGYIGTGYESINGYFKDFWEYDPTLNTWTKKADFGGSARSDAVGFSIGNRGYIGTGWAGTGMAYGDWWEYDSTVDSWTKKADFAGGGTARLMAVGFSIGSKGYVGTGGDSVTVGYLKDFWEYDPTSNSWGQKTDFGGLGRVNAVGFSIGSKGYIGTGFAAQVMERKDFWEYDPQTIGIKEEEEKNQISVFPNPFHELVNISINSKIDFPFDAVLIDISGKEVQKKSGIYSSNFQLMRESLPVGIYILKISDHSQEGVFTKRIIAI